MGIFHDITELKRAEQIRIDFVSNVSHELRTPLTSIKGYSDTLSQDLKKGDLSNTQRFLEVIERNVDRLMNLVNDLLDLSSLESGADLQKEIIQTKEITERILTQLQAKYYLKQQTLETKYKAATLLGDPKRIEQIMVNLIENAIKYIPEGGKIKISWEPDTSSALPGGVLLRVSDNGPGIEPTHLPRLFERFYRVDKNRSREMGGTGLGLAIVKHIVQRHGGRIEVKSTLGKGTEFVCHFPGA